MCCMQQFVVFKSSEQAYPFHISLMSQYRLWRSKNMNQWRLGTHKLQTLWNASNSGKNASRFAIRDVRANPVNRSESLWSDSHTLRCCLLSRQFMYLDTHTEAAFFLFTLVGIFAPQVSKIYIYLSEPSHLITSTRHTKNETQAEVNGRDGL